MYVPPRPIEGCFASVSSDVGVIYRFLLEVNSGANIDFYVNLFWGKSCIFIKKLIIVFYLVIVF